MQKLIMLLLLTVSLTVLAESENVPIIYSVTPTYNVNSINLKVVGANFARKNKNAKLFLSIGKNLSNINNSITVDTSTFSDTGFDVSIPNLANGDYLLRISTDAKFEKEQSTAFEITLGATGQKGDKGDKGDPGIQGPAGQQGEKGDTGPTGSQGPQGLTGETGATGAQGPQGDIGLTGPAGAPGLSGFFPATTQITIQGLTTVATGISCGQGSVAISGGWGHISNGLNILASHNDAILGGSRSAWRFLIRNNEQESAVFNGYIICVTVAP